MTKNKYAIPGFTKGKYFCSLSKTGPGIYAECKMAVLERHAFFIKWGGTPDCKKCDISKERKARARRVKTKGDKNE